MAQQFVTSAGAAVGPRIQEIDQGGTVVQRPVAYWRHVSWGAIFAGATLAIATQMLLTLLGAGIGLVALGATEGARAEPFGIGAAIWWLITGLVSLFIGGLAAGRLSRAGYAIDGLLHGLLVWSVTTVFSAWLLTTAAANLIGGAFSGMTQYLSSPNAPSVGEMIPGVTGQEQGSVGGQGPMGQGPGANQPAAGERVGGLEGQQGQQPGANIREEDVQEAASATGQAALWSFFALTLGAVAAAWGGSAGRKMFSSWDEPTTVVSRTTTHQQPAHEHHPIRERVSDMDNPNP